MELTLIKKVEVYKLIKDQLDTLIKLLQGNDIVNSLIECPNYLQEQSL